MSDLLINEGDLLNEGKSDKGLTVLYELQKKLGPNTKTQVLNLSANDNLSYVINTPEGEYIVRELHGTDVKIYDNDIFKDDNFAKWVPKIKEVYNMPWGGLYGKYDYFKDSKYVPITDLSPETISSMVADLDKATRAIKTDAICNEVKRRLIKRVQRIGIMTDQRSEATTINTYIQMNFNKGLLWLGFRETPKTILVNSEGVSIGCPDRLIPQFRRNVIIDGVNYSTRNPEGHKIRFMTELTDMLIYVSRKFSYQNTGDLIKVDLQYFIDKYIVK